VKIVYALPVSSKVTLNSFGTIKRWNKNLNTLTKLLSILVLHLWSSFHLLKFQSQQWSLKLAVVDAKNQQERKTALKVHIKIDQV